MRARMSPYGNVRGARAKSLPQCKARADHYFDRQYMIVKIVVGVAA